MKQNSFSRIRVAWLVGSLTAMLVCTAANSAPLTAPRLEDVPAPTITGALPAPATWPVLRYDHPPHLLVLTAKGSFVSAYQAIARRMHGSLDARYVYVGLQEFHVSDQWIEPHDAPSVPDLTVYAKQVIVDTLHSQLPSPHYDVIFVDTTTNLMSDPVFTAALIDYMRAGGTAVIVGSIAPTAGTDLAAVWPATASSTAEWMSGGSVHADVPELAGVPTEYLTSGDYIALEAVARGARALATGESGQLFASRVGKGTLLYSPDGPMGRAQVLFDAAASRYDHDEIWLRYWDQALYETTAGSKAFPAYVDDFQAGTVTAPGKDATASPDGTIKLKGIVVNRSASGALVGSVHVVDPLGHVVYRADVPVSAAPGSQAPVSASIPVSPAWSAGLYRVYFTLGDAADHKQLHSALGFVAVTGAVTLAVTPSKPRYHIGETAQMTVTASSSSPWTGKLMLGIYDYRGRLLARDERSASLSAAPTTVTFDWPVIDEGVKVDTYMVVAGAEKDGVEWARAESQFDKSALWSTRNEYQWSDWSDVAVAHPSTMLAAMRLMAHAGLNTLGYPGQYGIWYPAQRWGWRYYNEGIGINTFSPTIDYDSEAAIDAEVRRQAAAPVNRDLTSPALVLASIGEEAGFNSGWGVTYYWPTPTAPDVACRAFQWYLKTRYPSLGQLNAAWQTAFQSWDDVKLTKDFSGDASQYLQNDGWAHPKAMPPLNAGFTGVSLAPFADTHSFYAWYYDKFVAAAKRVFREQTNPVSLTIASAPSSPTFVPSSLDVPGVGQTSWTEAQSHSVGDSADPGFAIAWPFDWLTEDDDVVWSNLMQRSGHNDYWTDALTLNGDLTHTRTSMNLRRWTSRLADHEQDLLDSHPANADVGILPQNGIYAGQDFINMHTTTAVSVQQGGFQEKVATVDDLANYKIVFAVGDLSVSAEDARKMQAYVQNGGTLVFTPRFASQNEYGGSQAQTPGQGLAQQWGLTLDSKSVTKESDAAAATFALDGVSPDLKGQVASESASDQIGGFRQGVRQSGWNVLASYPDGTPAVMTRSDGKGKLVYFNAVYAAHHYIQFVTPTDKPRQGFYKLIIMLCREAGAQQTLRMDGDLAQMLHVAVKQFTDESGHIRYVIVKSSIGAPWISGSVEWLNPHAAVYDVLSGTQYRSTLPLHFGPSDGRWYAVLDQPVKRLAVSVSPATLVAGQPFHVTVRVIGEDGNPVPGDFPLGVSVTGNGNEIAGLHRGLSLPSGGSTEIATALTDPAGMWTVTVTDGITGLAGHAVLHATSTAQTTAPAMRSLGWPSENTEPQVLTADDFVGRLRSVSALYLHDQSAAVAKPWLVKQELGEYFDWFPGTRHDLMRPLYDVDWRDYVTAMRGAINAGDTIVLTGEDLGVDPSTGLSIYPHFYAHQFDAIAELLHGAAWRRGTADGDTVEATVGSGRVILCRESIDSTGFTSPGIVHWQQRWLAELGKDQAGPVFSALDATQLRQWWCGMVRAGEGPRVVTWFSDNQREETVKFDPGSPLDSVVVLALPPGGKVTDADMQLSSSSGAIRLDVGADGGSVLTVSAADAASWANVSQGGSLAASITRYLATMALEGGPIRDLSGWRLVPIRIVGAAKTDVGIRNLRISVE